jgi:hypothetical protein
MVQDSFMRKVKAMMRFEYEPWEVWKRILPFQLIPVIGIYCAVALQRGGMQTNSPGALQLIFTIGFIMYAIVMAFMINGLLRPEVLSIEKSGRLAWRPAFKRFETSLDTGTYVEVVDGSVRISPPVIGIPASHIEGNTTIIKIPAGVKGYSSGSFTVQPI